MSVQKNPEYESIESFLEFCADDERTEFSHVDLALLSASLKTSPWKVRIELQRHGLTLAERAVVKQTRGFSTSSHDRWYGPGSLATHGGAGIDADTGRATVKGKTI